MTNFFLYFFVFCLISALVYPFVETFYYYYIKPSEYTMEFIVKQINKYDDKIKYDKEVYTNGYELDYCINMLDYWESEKKRLEFQIKKGIIKI